MTGGTEWLVDAFGCDPEALRDPKRLAALGDRLIALLELTVIGSPLSHRFGGAGGVTALYLLSESHLAWHTYPESQLLTLNVYCCRSRSMLDWTSLLASTLGAASVTVRTLERGVPAPADASVAGRSA